MLHKGVGTPRNSTYDLGLDNLSVQVFFSRVYWPDSSAST